MDHARHADYRYATPRDLRVTPTPLRRVIITGSCGTEPLALAIATTEETCPIDFVNLNHGGFLPEAPPRPFDEYDFQLVQLPIRVILLEGPLMRLSYGDQAGHQALLDTAFQTLEFCLDNALRWSREHGLPAFVLNFLTPQQNPFGRLLPRYDCRNLVHVVELLNRRLVEIVEAAPNAYLLDADQVAAMFGRKIAQDDGTNLFLHGGLMTDWDQAYDMNRLQPVTPLVQQYAARPFDLLASIWEEACAMFRTIRQIDSVKIIIVDLDDTIWRGVVAEGQGTDYTTTEGWPIGFVEALLYFKKRGGLLAIVSKNERATIEAVWPQIYGGRLELSDFAAIRINWEFKAENIAAILADVNLLPRSAVFIDDNPVERAAVGEAFPDLRIIGANPYILRRIVLWSPETQVPTITAESLRRTEMIQSQAEREGARQKLSREDFLASLAPKVILFTVDGASHPKFPRTFELLNKTNQFNTTGRRWTQAELEAFRAAGGAVHAFEVIDKYTEYGLVGILLVSGSEIVQFVMSCRVLGLGVEIAVLSHLVGTSIPTPVHARLIETDANAAVRDLWSRAGLTKAEEGFFLPQGATIPKPGHVTLVADAHAQPPQPLPEPAAPQVVAPQPFTSQPVTAQPVAAQPDAFEPPPPIRPASEIRLVQTRESPEPNPRPRPEEPKPLSSWDILRAGPVAPAPKARPQPGWLGRARRWFSDAD